MKIVLFLCSIFSLLIIVGSSCHFQPRNEFERLTFDGHSKSGLSWSPDGRYIAYGDWGPADVSPPERSSLYIVDIKTKKLEKLMDSDNVIMFTSWSHDGKRIILSITSDIYYPGKGWSAISVFDIKDRKAEIIEKTEGEGMFLSGASFSPGEDKVVYVKGEYLGGWMGAEYSHIWVMDTESKVTSQLTQGEAIDFAPHWSPEGKEIAFIGSTSKNSDAFVLWIMASDGSNAKSLNLECLTLEPFSWSPDAKWIAYAPMYSDSGLKISSLLDGKPITFAEGLKCHYPTWSPNGEKIAFIVECQKEEDIWLMDVPDSLQPQE